VEAAFPDGQGRVPLKKGHLSRLKPLEGGIGFGAFAASGISGQRRQEHRNQAPPSGLVASPREYAPRYAWSQPGTVRPCSTRMKEQANSKQPGPAATEPAQRQANLNYSVDKA